MRTNKTRAGTRAAVKKSASKPAAPKRKLSKLPVNTIINGDSIEALSKLPDASVDLVFADPPSNL